MTGKLKNLERRGVEKIQRKAVNAWTIDVNKVAKPRIPKRFGNLRKSYGRKVKKYGSKVVGLVGARKGFRVQIGVRVRGKHKGQPIFADPTKYDHLVEFGHGGPSPARAYPHLRPAIDVTGDKPIVRELTQGLIEEVK